MKIYLNGRFLLQKMTGVQRFGRELIFHLDQLLDSENSRTEDEWILIAPNGTPAPQGLRKLTFVTFGDRRGHLWEQIDLFRATRRGLLVNLCNSGPLAHSKQLTVIHDAAVFRFPSNFSFAYATCHRLLGRALARRSRVATVSDFSRHELAELLHLKIDQVPVIPNGGNQILRNAADLDIVKRLNLVNVPFFLFVGSPTPNKNLSKAIDAFRRLSDPYVRFVIVGTTDQAVFHSGIRELPENVVMPGRLTDCEIVALYRNARALVFPSIYEGFGIPPLEAMLLNCPVIAAEIPVLREICGNAALYCSPTDTESIVRGMQAIMRSQSLRQSLMDKGLIQVQRYTWTHSAEKLMRVVDLLSV
jgi:glycosyltransferase involved in cell wall biosynthesis